MNWLSLLNEHTMYTSYTCIRVCKHPHIHTHPHIHIAPTHTHLHTTCTHACTKTWMHIYWHMYILALIHTHSYTHAHTYTPTSSISLSLGGQACLHSWHPPENRLFLQHWSLHEPPQPLCWEGGDECGGRPWSCWFIARCWSYCTMDGIGNHVYNRTVGF